MKSAASGKKTVGASGLSGQSVGRGGRCSYNSEGKGKSKPTDSSGVDSKDEYCESEETESKHIASCGICACFNYPVCSDDRLEGDRSQNDDDT